MPGCDCAARARAGKLPLGQPPSRADGSPPHRRRCEERWGPGCLLPAAGAEPAAGGSCIVGRPWKQRRLSESCGLGQRPGCATILHRR
jgi:hypothetical protein